MGFSRLYWPCGCCNKDRRIFMSIYSDAGYPCKYRAVILIQESFLNCSVVLLVFKSRVLENRLLQLHLAYLGGALLFQYVYWSFIRCRLVSSTRVKQVPGSNCFAKSCSRFQETSTSNPVLIDPLTALHDCARVPGFLTFES